MWRGFRSLLQVPGSTARRWPGAVCRASVHPHRALPRLCGETQELAQLMRSRGRVGLQSAGDKALKLKHYFY